MSVIVRKKDQKFFDLTYRKDFLSLITNIRPGQKPSSLFCDKEVQFKSFFPSTLSPYKKMIV
jgi:hypothetical protein